MQLCVHLDLTIALELYTRPYLSQQGMIVCFREPGISATLELAVLQDNICCLGVCC